ncbi:MAG: hypothetical protein ABIW38_04370 [Ferruginibacter sp.]
MTRQLIKQKIDKLPENKIEVVADYIDYVLQKSEEEETLLLIAFQDAGGSFDFLKDEPELYTDDKLIEVYK